ncbi:MAG: M23 family metallopeptidase [Myxococcota bacterium]
MVSDALRIALLMPLLLLPASAVVAWPCGDIDRSGARDGADLQLLREHIAGAWPVPLDAEQQSLCLVSPYSVGCDIVQAAALGRALGGDLLLSACPLGDDDDDGVPNQDDACIDSIGIGPAVVLGCSAIDLAANPEALLDPLMREVADLINIANESAGGDPASVTLGGVAGQLGAAASSLRRGNPCQALADLNQTALALESASAVIDAWMDSDLAANPPPAVEDDVSEGEAFRNFLLSLRDHVDAAVPTAAAAATVASGMCSSVTSLQVSDVVEELDDARGRLRLRGGDWFQLAEGIDIDGALSQGAEVSISGAGFGLSSGVATAIAASHPVALVEPSCLAFRFTPVQRQRPFRIGPALKLDPQGFFSNDSSAVYLMEHGMGLAVERTCPPPPSNTAFEHHYLTVSASFLLRAGTNVVNFPLWPELTPQDEPALLPSYIDPNAPVSLTATPGIADCTRSIGPGGGLETTCTNHRSLPSTNYSVELRERGERCTLGYNDRAFVLDEHDANDWAEAQVTQVQMQAHQLPGTFRAEARPICTSGGSAPCPFLQTVLQGTSFAIQNTDFLPIHPTWGPQMIFASGMHGVARPAGVQWPRVRGSNLGLDWQFSCRPPKVARDALALCPIEPTDTYYRLPFPQGYPDWTLAQGNNSGGSNSHAQSYALDMGRGVCGDVIVAMRTGRVWALRDGRTCQNHANCSLIFEPPVCGSSCCIGPCPDNQESQCKGNWVRIRHADESYGLYHHLKSATIQVQVGQLVRRGEVVAQMGTTGPSAGVHLHTSAENPPIASDPPRLAGKGHLALFEAEAVPSGPDLTCNEPFQNEILRSTNTPPPP